MALIQKGVRWILDEQTKPRRHADCGRLCQTRNARRASLCG